jgi:outer membrane usher protein
VPNFTLDPGFLAFPTPTLSAAPALPSTVQAFVNGALAYSGAAPAGPFTLTDLPTVVGAGQVRLVLTDLLGRQQVVSLDYYAGSALLKPGLADWSAAVGAERRGYGAISDDYGPGFASAVYREGFAAFTVYGRAPAGQNVAAGAYADAIVATVVF